MIPLTNDHKSINMNFAPDSNGFPASNRQGLRSLGSIIGQFLTDSLYGRTLHKIHCKSCIFNNLQDKFKVYSALTFLLVSLLSTNESWALNTNLSKHEYVNRVVEAIYKAEGGSKTRHPYGILSVKTSNPRQTCYEVVNWRYAMWSSLPSKGRPSFISYLSKSYCPLGALNDPRGLNRNWQRNVNHFMEVAL